MTETVLSAPDSNGVSYALPLANLPQAFGYDGSNDLITITVVFQSITFIQTFTRDGGGRVTNISRFIPQ